VGGAARSPLTQSVHARDCLVVPPAAVRHVDLRKEECARTGMPPCWHVLPQPRHMAFLTTHALLRIGLVRSSLLGTRSRPKPVQTFTPTSVAETLVVSRFSRQIPSRIARSKLMGGPVPDAYLVRLPPIYCLLCVYCNLQAPPNHNGPPGLICASIYIAAPTLQSRPQFVMLDLYPRRMISCRCRVGP
jgi:hypothetical protein